MIVERIMQYIEYKGINKNIFYKETGLSNGFLDKVKDIGSSKIEQILNTYDDIEPNWLITGKGEMIVLKNNLVSEELMDYVVNKQPINVKNFKNVKPFYNQVIKSGKSITDYINIDILDGYIYNLPGLSSTINIFPVIGFSMLPEVLENALIGLKKVKTWETMDTSKKYLIITKKDRMIKYIEHDDNDNSIFWCLAPKYQKFKIYKEDIVEIHRITFVLNPA